MSSRLFVGLELPPALVQAYGEARDSLCRVDHRWIGEKWVAEQNLHVTTCFIGDVEDGSISALSDALSREIGAVPAFDLTPCRVAAVPAAPRARMIWAELIDDSGLATELATRVTDAAVPFGAELASKPYCPHVTLCRARRPRPVLPEAMAAANTLFEWDSEVMSVVSATLFVSRLTRRGPEYERLAAWRLRGADRP